MLAEVLLKVKQFSRDVQYIKHQLAEGTPQAATTPTFPIQLPVTTEEDVIQAESVLDDKLVCKQMVSYLSD